MAASRKPADTPLIPPGSGCAGCSACDPALLTALREAVRPLPADEPWAVGLSGGADSAMLALHLACLAAETGRPLHCLHVHHGLQAGADAWEQHAHHLAHLLGVHSHSMRVRVQRTGQGLEAAARRARYAAISELARTLDVAHVFLAHHQEDQVETVLFRLLRGAGPTALGGMAPVTTRDTVQFHRPWLTQPRARILACARRFEADQGWAPVDDPSNRDPRYARGVLRTQLAPVLDQHWPGWRHRVLRHAAQARELGAWVDEAAQADWQTLAPTADGQGFSLAAWRRLPAHRQAAVLRYWLQTLGCRMPTSARLADWLRQLRTVHALGHDRRVCLRHDGGAIIVQRGQVRFQRETTVE